MIRFSNLPDLCNGQLEQLAADTEIGDLITDSRKALITQHAVFFAITGDRHDGHRYIPDLYKQGIRQFVVERTYAWGDYPEGNFLMVRSSLKALQAIAAHHRKEFKIPVIGITGSNGKTIVKEWLYQLLSPDKQVVKNPGSYNSQLGVPLSVWQLKPHHEIGIFEAGISQAGEMENLARIIQPTLGIFTNIGTAHDKGFTSLREKVCEKLALFKQVKALIYCADFKDIDEEVIAEKIPAVSWAFQASANYKVNQTGNTVEITHQAKSYSFDLPFADKASVENALHCIVLMLYLKKSQADIQDRIKQLRTLPMRLELKQGINNSQIIDDSYSNDLVGLQISLDFVSSLQKKHKTVILSDLLQTGLSGNELANRIRETLTHHGVNRLIAIGPLLYEHQNGLKSSYELDAYADVEIALKEIQWDDFRAGIILVKGARQFKFERIVARLQRKVHGTRMEIDLNKMVHNLNFFRSKLKPGVKLMAMVKAFAYGSGSEEVANLLQYHRVDYLGVAYADEGVELRKNNITVPIMVMNVSEEGFAIMAQHNLEPVVYSLPLLKALAGYVQNASLKIHLEIETGMNRLGLSTEDLAEAIHLIKSCPQLTVASVYSHLAGADEKQHDGYSREQADRFNQAYEKISKALSQKPIRHLLNSPGILRLSQYQMDMVRLGIGLYGIDPTTDINEQLKPVATLKSVISQVKHLKSGETVGYGRWGKANQSMTIATIAIGYADGFSRSFSKGKGKVLVHGQLAPVIGNVCMDMTMIDITGIKAGEGDEVIIFGEGLSIQEVAASINTIPYEILTNTSERVKRVFFTESI